MDFQAIMKQIVEKQYEDFKKLLSDKMEKNYYLCVFLGSFLGDYFPMNKGDYLQFKSIYKDHVEKYFHKVIDKISLCGEEIEFFHEMIKIPNDEQYIQKCIEKYHSIENLDRCQLGENILKCLKASQHIIII
ncbi:hypothetical protein H012_gp055 [Acanthamoeba polyphaga moumouvirus]|uniref:Uncharacterized protein n=1 Tax=Acanthamoeba polyphaga moumouvirus TaxID=1269028 RepID=L7RE38_9VIRU|nr:hypothetical protein H012_gp055 [Acanthamoeba polyphaga moumouvirus]AGC02393.1 hypothetical protein Moumou_00878 [Acanthamoeba polyphaga moumouvirus]